LTATGSVVFAGIEGTRPLLVELQALVAPSPLGTPRRAVVGWDSARLSMILAVLEARCGVGLAGHDVYLNVAGGLRIAEPATHCDGALIRWQVGAVPCTLQVHEASARLQAFCWPGRWFIPKPA
jgi:predicted ATP-dependent serine protease